MNGHTPTAEVPGMFGLGAGEIILILVVALIFIGPAKLPDIARSLGKGMREFRRAADDLQHELSRDSNPKHQTPPKPSVNAPQTAEKALAENNTEPKPPLQPTAGFDDSVDSPTPNLPTLRPANDTIASGSAKNSQPPDTTA